jgi:hypothetical protein
MLTCMREVNVLGEFGLEKTSEDFDWMKDMVNDFFFISNEYLKISQAVVLQ